MMTAKQKGVMMISSPIFVNVTLKKIRYLLKETTILSMDHTDKETTLTDIQHFSRDPLKRQMIIIEKVVERI